MSQGNKRNTRGRWKQGWYHVRNPEKFLQPADDTMKSYKYQNGVLRVLYKSGLELKGFKYCDLNPKIEKWSLEPFAVPYISPVDQQPHRYFPDLWIQFLSGDIFLVEIKASGETKMPRKNDKQYASKLQTFIKNQCKWQSARQLATEKGLHFVILTEKELK